ncbi:MAG: CcmD family protein [Chloroflexi bacterium]|nr:CcmD family protein [Chloroflexota bacterium]
MEDLLRELLKEIRNLAYLFPAFLIVLVAIFAYFFSLSRRQEKLQDEIQALREAMSRQKEK